MPVFDCQVYIEGGVVHGVNQNAGQARDLLISRGIDSGLAISCRAACVDPLSGNRILGAMLEQTDGLYGAIVMHAQRTDASVQAARELLGRKRFLAAMLTSTTPQEPLPLPLAEELLNGCRRYQKPFLLLTFNAACVYAALELARKYPMHKFVFLGMGGADWQSAIVAGQTASNVLLELSGDMSVAKLPAAVEAVGSHRLLFGSSAPNLDPAAVLGLVDDCGLRPNDRRRILYDNAMKLFGIGDAE